MNSYSRAGYFALKKETTENVAVTPDVFVPIMSEDVVVDYSTVAATPIVGSRALNQRPIPNMIAPPSGTIVLLAEPKTLGHFLNGAYGSVASGQIVKISSLSADFTVGETITGGTSSETATVVANSTEGDFVLVSSLSGDLTVGETITGGTSSSTATVVDSSTTRYGHVFTDSDSLPTFTGEIGFKNEAIRYTGIRFNQIEYAQADNIIQITATITARAAFHHARVTAAVTSGAGSKTITVDQTTGLAASDTIKVYRIGTGYLDFSASSVKTHTVGTVASETSITITNLETSLQEGDLIVLAPQTPTYSIDREFSWIGGSVVAIDNTITSAVSASCAGVEDFNLSIVNNIEPLHKACGTNFVNRFPATNVLAGLEGTGSITRTYTDPTYISKLRADTDQAVRIKHVGREIGSTGLNYELDLRIPVVQFDPYNANLESNSVIKEEISYTIYDGLTDGYFAKAILINDVTSY